MCTKKANWLSKSNNMFLLCCYLTYIVLYYQFGDVCVYKRLVKLPLPVCIFCLADCLFVINIYHSAGLCTWTINKRKIRRIRVSVKPSVRNKNGMHNWPWDRRRYYVDKLNKLRTHCSNELPWYGNCSDGKLLGSKTTAYVCPIKIYVKTSGGSTFE